MRDILLKRYLKDKNEKKMKKMNLR